MDFLNKYRDLKNRVHLWDKIIILISDYVNCVDVMNFPEEINLTE